MTNCVPRDVTTSAHLRCERLWKVFGPHEKALSRTGSSTLDPAEVPPDAIAAVKDVTFEVKPAETLVIMGLSGSGKSTLIRCLTRLIEPTAGRVFFDGQCVNDMKPAQLREFHRHQCGMVFQHFGLFPHRTVLDNVAFGLEVRGVARSVREERAMQMLDLVGLARRENYYPSELSGGMKQRVGLARALAVEPGLLLFDEPFSALDPLIRRDLQDELIRLRGSVQKTMVFITHDMSEALKLGDRIAIMRDGELVQIGTPEEIVLSPADEYVQRFVSDTPRTHVLRAGTVASDERPLNHSTPPSEAMALLSQTPRDAGVVVDADGKPVGAVSKSALRSAIDRGDLDLAGALALAPQVRSSDDLEEVTRVLAAGEHRAVAVVDDVGRFIGCVDATSALQALVGTTATRSSAMPKAPTPAARTPTR